MFLLEDHILLLNCPNNCIRLIRWAEDINLHTWGLNWANNMFLCIGGIKPLLLMFTPNYRDVTGLCHHVPSWDQNRNVAQQAWSMVQIGSTAFNHLTTQTNLCGWTFFLCPKCMDWIRRGGQTHNYNHSRLVQIQPFDTCPSHKVS